MRKRFPRQKTFPVRLTPYELIHIRDLFSVLLVPDVQQTLSQALAALEDRPVVEARLWQRIVAACKTAGVPTGDHAPDFVTGASAPPPVGVFRLATEPADVDRSRQPVSSTFDADDEQE